jgi:hypothetical protein
VVSDEKHSCHVNVLLPHHTALKPPLLVSKTWKHRHQAWRALKNSGSSVLRCSGRTFYRCQTADDQPKLYKFRHCKTINLSTDFTSHVISCLKGKLPKPSGTSGKSNRTLAQNVTSKLQDDNLTILLVCEMKSSTACYLSLLVFSVSTYSGLEMHKNEQVQAYSMSNPR